VGRATDAELRLLPSEVVWLLLTEAWRVSDVNAASRLRRHAHGPDVPRIESALEFIGSGKLPADFDDISDVHLAVLWFARGRRLATLGKDADAAYAEAKRLDAFHAVVWQAHERWAPP